VVFPNAASLQLCKNAADLALPGSKIRIIVLDSICAPPGAPAPLTEVWARIHGLPPCLLETERLKAALGMVGNPIQVDPTSLAMEPKAVRVQFLIHVPVLPKLAVNLFVNGKGFKVLVVPDSTAPVSDDNSPPQPPRDDKDKDKEDEEDNETTDHNDSDSHWKRRKTKAADSVPASEPKAKPPSKQAAPAPVVVISARPKKAGVKPSKKKGTTSAPVMVAPARQLPSPSSAPAPRICQYGSNLHAGKSFAKKLAEAVSPAPPDSPLPISSDEDRPFVHEGKARNLSAAEREEIGWVSSDADDSEKETLAQKCKKLKVGRGFEGVAKKLDLASEASVGLAMPKGKRSVAVAAHISPTNELATPSKISKSGSAASTITSITPTSSVRRSERRKGQDKESVLEKAMRVQENKDSPALEATSEEQARG
jgi:hypothetical protein